MAKKVQKEKVDYSIRLEDVNILFKNFEGKKSQYNREGDRNFCVILTPEEAEQYSTDGWNVKIREPREEGDDPLIFMRVKVSFAGRYPPKVIVIKEGTRKQDLLTEDTINVLDYARIKHADVFIRPYNWGPNANGDSGVAAYLGTMYATVEADPFEEKYNFDGPPDDDRPPWED